ncbi:type I-F CRISPR-associated helicase Cas3f [Pseudobacteriovorax antillogorgiicola]|uniref:CRISPR-associated helicase, Cas3 family n=1 Tax=Pseudobacteriovorax antillogorgiicola TaxID=1513793 RepID=A0A1Y6CBJ5_9BACT|nr:type I-F CRISPR-associated helicase Cas3f [Pseudobacteriovorax antillogorgiicola]TCS49878.1 CRISPR-associated Cas3 family helicase [Pseudobacteriovorax antillogorgiicola]SMF44377.1 CRISPR-associated helicase, Cas3 family [Pseudobacteriovorax antillogorgiicola]
MIVVFNSLCEKKALSRTQRVLDSFANRIGRRTWSTTITMEGLLAVRKLLRKSATRNTAVSCFKLRGHSGMELQWIVGNKEAFSSEGYSPVHKTSIDYPQVENQWQLLPAIQALSALSALFHDIGKASECFQNKLKRSGASKSDPFRHEWVSTNLFLNFVFEKSDKKWLEELSINGFSGGKLPRPSEKLVIGKGQPIACLVAWLILSHHKLPHISKDRSRYENLNSAPSMDSLLQMIDAGWGYMNELRKNEQASCFTFPEGLLQESHRLQQQIRKWANRALGEMPLIEESIRNGSVRLLAIFSRVSLMMGDHLYSSEDCDKSWVESRLIANTDKNGDAKQKLDEHLVNVAKKSLKVSYRLPYFEQEMPYASDIKALRKPSPREFNWQDKAVKIIRAWYEKNESSIQSSKQYGFFVVNMASTGTGKTLANAKIMRALSPNQESLRYILAVGLRTLTLQTGNEYRKNLQLDSDSLAVLVGSKALMDLHHRRIVEDQRESARSSREMGSESLEDLSDYDDIDFQNYEYESLLKTVIKKDKDRAFLYAPILVCTIDHVMGATETRKGGKYILPLLRLMSSDIVIDEVDDFGKEDLLAVGRLIHLAGMLGRKVILSSATISPAIANGFFNCYAKGWKVFASSRGFNQSVGTAWIDEFQSVANLMDLGRDYITKFESSHQKFISKRLANLSKLPVRRKASLICLNPSERDRYNSVSEWFFEAIRKEAENLHHDHHSVDPLTGKRVSFGVIRMANVTPCVQLGRYLLEADWESHLQIKLTIYHSQQTLILRHEQESLLDEILNRKNADRVFSHDIVRDILDKSDSSDFLFIIVSTPVEEVGRNHDFDWGIIEPSSYRSIIQLVGRILRHRKLNVSKPNVKILEFNLREAQQRESNRVNRAVFNRPGFQEKFSDLSSHSLTDILDIERCERGIDASLRISNENTDEFAKLEHIKLEENLCNYDAKEAKTLAGWLNEFWWLSSQPQVESPFREGSQGLSLLLLPDESKCSSDLEFRFHIKSSDGYNLIEDSFNIKFIDLYDPYDRLFVARDFHQLLCSLAELENTSMFVAAEKYGKILLPSYQEGKKLCYHPALGMFEDKKL